MVWSILYLLQIVIVINENNGIGLKLIQLQERDS